MLRHSIVRPLIGSLSALAMSLSLWAPGAFAGDVNPPAGPVGPTMRTLDEVEPRTIVSQINTPGDLTATFVISQPGSYYLTGDVVGEFTKHGIRIDARDVTLDLSGFRVILPLLNAGIAPTVNGIHAWPDTGDPGAVMIRNGHVIGWKNGVGLLGPGVIADVAVWGNETGINTIGGSVLRCTADSNSLGMVISKGTAEDCVCSDNFTNGFSGVQTSLVRCVSNDSTQDGFLMLDGSSLRDCSASGNGVAGFDISSDSVAIGCRAYSNTGEGFTIRDSTARDCTAALNSFSGFKAMGNSALHGCEARDNLVNGFTATDTVGGTISPSLFTDCIARNNLSNGFDALDNATFEGCVSTVNGLDGFHATVNSVFDRCRARDNFDDGFSVGQGSMVTGCFASENNFGFYAVLTTGSGSRFDSNTAIDNTSDGFLISADNCIVVRNVAHGNGTDYSVNPIAQMGDVVTTIGLIGAVGPWSNFGTPSIEAADPFGSPVNPIGKR